MLSELLTLMGHYNSNKELTVYWENGLIIQGVSDSINEWGEYSDPDESKWFDYYAALIKINKVLQWPSDSSLCDRIKKERFVPHRDKNTVYYYLVEVSEYFEPYKIEVDGKIIWNK